MRASSCSFSVIGRACELEPEGSDGDMSSAAACSSYKEPQFQETPTPHDQKCNANVQLDALPCCVHMQTRLGAAHCVFMPGGQRHIDLSVQLRSERHDAVPLLQAGRCTV